MSDKEASRPLILALGGGAARGAAHLGALHVLDRAGVKPSGLVGTSVGAVVAAAYALGWSPESLLARARTIRWRHLVAPSSRPLSRSLVQTDRWRSLLREDLGLRSFSDLRIPTAIVTTDLVSGRSVVVDGSSDDLDLTEAILASSAVPGLFPPVERGSKVLVDGGLMNNLPVDVARDLGATWAPAQTAIVVSIDLMAYPAPGSGPIGTIGSWQRSLSLLLRSNQGHDAGDVSIRPAIGEFPFMDFSSADQLFARGAQAAEEALPAIAEASAVPPTPI